MRPKFSVFWKKTTYYSFRSKVGFLIEVEHSTDSHVSMPTSGKNTFKVLFASIKTLTKDFTGSPIGISIAFILFHLTPHPFYAYHTSWIYPIGWLSAEYLTQRVLLTSKMVNPSLHQDKPTGCIMVRFRCFRVNFLGSKRASETPGLMSMAQWVTFQDSKVSLQVSTGGNRKN